MIRALRAYLIRRRFERLFVRPFQARINTLRKHHARGARQAYQDQQAFLHQALAASLASQQSSTRSGSR